MTVRQVLALLMILSGVCLVAMFVLPWNVRAAEPDTCQTVEEVIAAVSTEGGKVAGAAYYSGTVTDTMLVIESPAAIAVYGFRDGCLVTAVALEQRDAGTPA